MCGFKTMVKKEQGMLNLMSRTVLPLTPKITCTLLMRKITEYRNSPVMAHLLQSGVLKVPGDGEFNLPEGIDVDSLGYVYVADTGNSRVQKFTCNGTFVTKWGTKGIGDGEFSSHAHGIAIDQSNNVYVTDRFNNRIQKFTSNGTFLTKWGTNGTGNGEFNEPHSSAIDSLNNVYVSDMNNHRVQKFTSMVPF